MLNEPGTRRVRVPEGVARLLRDLIHERTGLFFEDTRTDFLIEKLEPAVQIGRFNSFMEYYYALRDNTQGEWDRAWDALSVQETYFWREMPQIRVLVEEIIPQWFRSSVLPFRVWSAACATGEEPYTIAMAVAEAGLTEQAIEIVGSDASPAALEKAQRGIYREKSFRSLPPLLRSKYFEEVPEGWKLCSEIKGRVKFRRANLLEPADVADLARVQTIFCRNAFIYFSRHSIRQTVAMMAAKMSPGGHLMVGASESLLRLTTDFELKEIGAAMVYVRI